MSDAFEQIALEALVFTGFGVVVWVGVLAYGWIARLFGWVQVHDHDDGDAQP